MNRILLGSLFFLILQNPVFAINLPLTAVDGSSANLNQFEGKWVVVNYWATWCPPCIEEIPELQAFHDENSKTAMVVGINSEVIDRMRLESFLYSFLIRYPIFVTSEGQPSELGEITNLPTTFLVSPGGKLVARQVGPVTQAMIE
ncbi:MAG: thiol-disulfide isomerase/thioredoxin, partial [Gammaproteobacteria bacterium]